METIKSSMLKLFKESIDVGQPIFATTLEETDVIEFKKSLHTFSETIDKSYLPTIAAFANNKGGTIIFGIDPVTKELVGIKPKYENLDNRYVSTTIRGGIDGSIEYLLYTHKYLGKLLGFLSIKVAESRPVIVKVDSGEAKRGEIYYRYSAQTTKIEAADLRKLINSEVDRRMSITLNALKTVIQVGGDNLAIINTVSGELETGDKETKYVLDRTMLDQLNLIKRGEFVEEQGAPAYIIKGEIELEASNVDPIEVLVPTLTSESELYEHFFSGECEHPEIMIKQLLFSHTQYNPFFFFLNKSKLNNQDAKTFINSVEHNNLVPATRDKLLQRLESDTYSTLGTMVENIKHNFSHTKSVDELVSEVITALDLTGNRVDQKVIRTVAYNTITNKLTIPDEIYENHLKRVIEAISHIERDFILDNKSLIIRELEKIYKCKRKPDETSFMRKVICHIDKILYEPFVV